jgi:hypothetical protein
LLNAYFPDENFKTIPANIQDSVDVWRQASENNVREDLNAVGKARQLALLLMHLIFEHNQTEFRPINAFDHELDFYAQVADGNAYRVPQGTYERLLTGTGLKNNSQVRRYRAILTLDRSTWDRADDEDWTEGKIRKHLEKMRASDNADTESPPLDMSSKKLSAIAGTIEMAKLTKREKRELRDWLNSDIGD